MGLFTTRRKAIDDELTECAGALASLHPRHEPDKRKVETMFLELNRLKEPYDKGRKAAEIYNYICDHYENIIRELKEK